MRKFTKMMLTLALLIAGVGGANAGNHYLEINTNAVKANAWEWAIWYQLDTPLESGETYVLTMDAICSEAFNIPFWPVNTNEGGKTKYTGYNIGTEWSTCTCEFEANDALNRLVWDFGALNGFLRFDNIKLVKKGETTNLISGGDFESGLDSHWGNDGWNKPEYFVYESENTPTRCLKMTTNAVKDNAWEWAIWYKLDTPLEKDKKYTLTMKAKCSEAYNMPFWPYKNGGATCYTGYNIGTEWGDCSCTFTANDDLEYLKWCFGSLNGTVYFDDVCLVEQGTTTNLINDGGFDNGLAPEWGDDGWNKPDYGVVIEYPAVEATVPSTEVQLSKGMFKSWDSPDAGANITSNSPYWTAIEYGEEGGSGAVIYGSGNVYYLDYADISQYSAMKVYGTGSNLRIMMNRMTDGGALTEVRVSPSPEGTLLDLTSYSFVHLNGIKVVNDGGATTITNITLIDPSVKPGTDYALSGDLKDGSMTASATSALADSEAKVIDVKSATGRNIALTSTNLNCLFLAQANQLTNNQNIIVGTNCANLVLADGAYNFNAPFDFDATTITFGREFVANQNSTVCLPFALTAAEASELGTFYQLGNYANGTLTFTEVEEPEAYKPYLFVPTATTIAASNKDIAATPASLIQNGTGADFVGTMTAQTIKSDGEYDIYGYKTDGTFVKVGSTNGAHINPFRAYVRIPKADGSRSVLNINFGSEETTGITDVKREVLNDNNQYYNLNGQRVAQPVKGLYINNGKKVILK